MYSSELKIKLSLLHYVTCVHRHFVIRNTFNIRIIMIDARERQDNNNTLHVVKYEEFTQRLTLEIRH